MYIFSREMPSRVQATKEEIEQQEFLKKVGHWPAILAASKEDGFFRISRDSYVTDFDAISLKALPRNFTTIMHFFREYLNTPITYDQLEIKFPEIYKDIAHEHRRRLYKKLEIDNDSRIRSNTFNALLRHIDTLAEYIKSSRADNKMIYFLLNEIHFYKQILNQYLGNNFNDLTYKDKNDLYKELSTTKKVELTHHLSSSLVELIRTIVEKFNQAISV